MSAPRPMRGYVRNGRKRKLLLDVDLNVPAGETLEDSTLAVIAPAQIVGTGNGSSGSGGSVSQVPATIDVEAIDDEVVISSPRRFAEARRKSRRNNNGTAAHEVSRSGYSEEIITRLTLNDYIMRGRVPPNLAVIDCDRYIDLESTNGAKKKTQEQPVQSIPPPKEPTFSCPVCMGPLVEEASTKCGHIFCKKCISAAIRAQNKCPTCRRKLTMKDIIRVYLPTTT